MTVPITQLSTGERRLFDNSKRIIGVLNQAFNPQILQGLKQIITFPAAGVINRRGRIYIQTKASKGGALAWSIGQKIRTARERKNLTQEDLAKLTGIARANIARFETGRHAPKIATVQRVARSLDLKTTDLLKMPGHEKTREDSDWINADMDEWSKSLEREDRKS
ncbi:MAG: helix-turn-helix transcriptional regulator [Elusimicrobia bacterium]|nr:helix-turn-helix transcriptional regulator [Elusimicrobiota bacterium]